MDHFFKILHKNKYFKCWYILMGIVSWLWNCLNVAGCWNSGLIPWLHKICQWFLVSPQHFYCSYLVPKIITLVDVEQKRYQSGADLPVCLMSLKALKNTGTMFYMPQTLLPSGSKTMECTPQFNQNCRFAPNLPSQSENTPLQTPP